MEKPLPAKKGVYRIIVSAYPAAALFICLARRALSLARSSCVKDGRTSAVWQIDVSDELGTAVALFTGTGFKL